MRPLTTGKARHRADGSRAALGLLAAIGLAAAIGATTATAQEPPKKTLEVATGTLDVETVASGLSFPWSLVFLPEGGMLVSEKHPGRLRRVAMDGTLGDPIEGLPPIFAEGNGGLLGIALDPSYATNGRVYFAYAEPAEEGKAALAVGRARFTGDQLEDVETIWRQTPAVKDVRNFGGRLKFRAGWAALRDDRGSLRAGSRCRIRRTRSALSRGSSPTAASRPTIPSPAPRTTTPPSGPGATATSKAPRSIRRAGVSGRTSSGLGAATN